MAIDTFSTEPFAREVVLTVFEMHEKYSLPQHSTKTTRKNGWSQVKSQAQPSGREERDLQCYFFDIFKGLSKYWYWYWVLLRPEKNHKFLGVLFLFGFLVKIDSWRRL